MFKRLVLLAAAIVLVFAEEDVVKQAIAHLDSNGVSGDVKFIVQDNGNVRITGKITGMPPGMYGFHVHEKGDLSGGCATAGPHFNPNKKNHGHPGDEDRHVGDLGNIEFDSSKTANMDFTDHEIKLSGRHNIIGRALILHEKHDDYGKTDHPDSKITGNAGGRVVCAVIGIL